MRGGDYAKMRTKSGRKVLVVVTYLGPEHSRVQKWRGSARRPWAPLETVPTAELSAIDPVADSGLLIAAGKVLP